MRRPLLLPFNPLYGLAVGIRNLMFDKGILKSVRFETPTLVVGNLSAGGTGKTPHTEYLLRLFGNKKAAVISRGYGRKTKGFHWVNAASSASDVGDEPLQMKNKFPLVPFAVCEDRVLAVPQLIADYPDTELIVFDDAFQHRYLDGKCKILLSTRDDLFTRDMLLPAGNLRESKSGAGRADIILVTKCPANISETEMQEIEADIRHYSDAPVYFSRFDTDEIIFPFNSSYDTAHFKDQKVFIFSAIAGGSQWANPYINQFKGKAGELCYRDHHAFSIHDIRLLKKKWEAEGKPIILTTEKDFMRLKSFEEELKDLPLCYFPIQVRLLKDEASLRKHLEFHLFNS